MYSNEHILLVEISYKYLIIKYYKLRVLFNILEESLSNGFLSVNSELKKYVLLYFLPKVYTHLKNQKQIKREEIPLSAKECRILGNYIFQQIPLSCEPMLRLFRVLLKQQPQIFDQSFARKERVKILTKKRSDLISSILIVKKRKTDLLIKLVERKISPENESDFETTFLKFCLRELKARLLMLSVSFTSTNEDSHALTAYKDVEKHLNDLLFCQGLTDSLCLQ